MGDGGGEGRYQHVTGKTPLPPSLLFPSFLLQRLVSLTVMRGKTKRFSSGTPRGQDYPIRSATMRACKCNTSTEKLPTRDETQCYSSCFLVNPARCVSGSTLLHTASFFGAIPVIKVLSVTEWLPTQMLSQLRLSALSTKKTCFAISLPS